MTYYRKKMLTSFFSLNLVKNIRLTHNCGKVEGNMVSGRRVK